MIIRQYSANDIPQLIKMRYDFSIESKESDPHLFEVFSDECEEFFHDIKNSDRWKIWVAEDNGTIVSHIFLEIIDTVPRPGRKKSPWGYMTNVYTMPEYRSKGIGGKIADEINVWAKEAGLTFLLVWPSESSVDFYSRHGFQRAEEVMENHFEDQ